MAISDHIRRCKHCGSPTRRTKPSEPPASFCSRRCKDGWRRGRVRVPLVERFWSKVARAGDDECWLWLGAVSGATGYGSVYLGPSEGGRPGGGRIAAHRLAYELSLGRTPDGALVCHRCDVRTCVNPRHLFLGTPMDNVVDMYAKSRQRHARGEGRPEHKLTEQDVREIRLSCRPHRDIAAQYGISAPLVSRIKSRKKWAHVT